MSGSLQDKRQDSDDDDDGDMDSLDLNEGPQTINPYVSKHQMFEKHSDQLNKSR